MILWMISAVIGMLLLVLGVLIGSYADKMSDLYGFCEMAVVLGTILSTINLIILFAMDVTGVI